MEAQATSHRPAGLECTSCLACRRVAAWKCGQAGKKGQRGSVGNSDAPGALKRGRHEVDIVSGSSRGAFHKRHIERVQYLAEPHLCLLRSTPDTPHPSTIAAVPNIGHAALSKAQRLACSKPCYKEGCRKVAARALYDQWGFR